MNSNPEAPIGVLRAVAEQNKRIRDLTLAVAKKKGWNAEWVRWQAGERAHASMVKTLEDVLRDMLK